MWLFQMVGHSLRDRAVQYGTATIHPRPILAFHLSRSTQTLPLALCPSTIRTEHSGRTMCCPRAASHLQLPSLIAGPTAWTRRTQVPTQMSTILTPTFTQGTTTPCSIHTPPTALQRWIPGLILCCCPVLGTRIRPLAPHITRPWRPRWTPASTAPSRLPLSHGPPRPSMDPWRPMTQVASAEQIQHSVYIYLQTSQVLYLHQSFQTYVLQKHQNPPL